MQTLLSRMCFFAVMVLLAAVLAAMSLSLALNPNDSTDVSLSASQAFQPLTSGFGRMADGFAHMVKASAHATATTASDLVLPAIGSDSIFSGTARISAVHAAEQTTATTLPSQPMLRLVVNLTDVPAFIQPAADLKVPVIHPVAATTAVTAPSEAPASPAVSAPAPPEPPASPPSVPAAASPISTPNSYAWGNCTWWTAHRRAQIGAPIPNSWGNAATWAIRAESDGYRVDHTPSPGAIMQTANSAHGLGHVAFVESVDPDGTWHISEMNAVGLDVVDDRAEPPAAAAAYYFIH